MKKVLLFLNILFLCVFISVMLISCSSGDNESHDSGIESDTEISGAEDSSEDIEETSGEEGSQGEESGDIESGEESTESGSESSAESSIDPVSSNESSKETSKDTSSVTSKETSKETSKTTSKETSKEVSKETSKETSSTTSKDTSKETSSTEPAPDPNATATPAVYGCTKIETGCFVIMGTCEEGATIYAEYGSTTVSSKSDKGYFSIRIKSSASSTNVKLYAKKSGKNTSKTLEYTAKPKSVSSSQWKLIAGSNYQFHLEMTMADYLRNNTYSENTLQFLTDTVRMEIDELNEYYPDTEIIYMLVPNPATVYPETVPSEYKPSGNTSRLDQISKALKEGGATVIDLKSALTSHKNDALKIYWKTDSHWTDYGAFIAYTELFNHISKKFPSAAPRAYSEFNWIEKYYIGGDISHYLEYYNINLVQNGSYPYEALMKEWNALRKPKFSMPSSITNIKRYVSDDILTYNTQTVQNAHTIRTNRSNLPSALVLRDSYSTQIFDIMAERFDTTYYKAMWGSVSDYISEFSRLGEAPDYIIYIFVERNLNNILR